MLAINTGGVSAVDAPFGGVKWSGYGSEDGREVILGVSWELLWLVTAAAFVARDEALTGPEDFPEQSGLEYEQVTIGRERHDGASFALLAC